MWLRQLLEELGFEQGEATNIFEDNHGCERLSKNPTVHNRTKHIDIRHHYVRERTEDGEVILRRIPSEDNPADLMTKTWPAATVVRLKGTLGLHDVSM